MTQNYQQQEKPIDTLFKELDKKRKRNKKKILKQQQKI